MKSLFTIPADLWFKVFKYYSGKLFGLRVSEVESNWVYFLKMAKTHRIKISKEPNGFLVYNPLYNHCAKIRGGRSSDVLVYIQLFFHDEYKPLVKFLAAHKNLTIIDAGANVGFFTLYATHYCPTASVYCIEPDYTNYNQIQKQVQVNQLQKIFIERAALWHEPAMLKFKSQNDQLEWSYSMETDAMGEVKALTLHDLVKKYQLAKIDVFKLDVEGAEAKLFEDDGFVSLFSALVKVCMMETHKKQEKEAIIEKLKFNKFVVEEFRELVLAYKL